MNNTWDYANLVQKVHQNGGPDAFLKKIKNSSYSAGYLCGRSDGLRNGVLWMLPFVAGTGYLLYEKGPMVWKKIKNKVCVARREIKEEEKQEQKKQFDILCPHCGAKAISVDMDIKLYILDKDGNEDLMRQAKCPKCGEVFNY